MKKFALITLAIVLALSIASPALATDLVLQSGSQITVDDMTFTINGSVDSITVNASDFTVTITNSSATIVSNDKYTLSSTYGVFDCYTGYSQMFLQNSGTVTHTVTPSSTVCNTTSYTGGGSNSGGTSSGGGGGGVSPTSGETTPVTTTTPLTSLDNYASGGGEVTLANPVSQSVFASTENSVALSDNSVNLSLPAGAVSDSGSLSITPEATYAQPKAGYAAVKSQAFEISLENSAGAEVTQLNGTATLTFSYTDEQISGFSEGTLVVSYWDENLAQWVDLTTTVNAAGNTITATTNHFTKFIIQAKSLTVPAGSLVKTASNPAVYYIGHDGERYTFSDDKVFYSWYTNFDDVITITDSQMYAFPLGGNITVRPGTKLIQFVGYTLEGQMTVGDPKVYAVEPGGVRRWIETASIAQTLFGSNWEQKIYAVPTTLAGFYSLGSSLAEPVYPSGAVVKETSSNKIYYINAAEKRLINTDGLSANGFQALHYNSATSLSSYALSTDLNDYQNSISWTGGK